MDCCTWPTWWMSSCRLFLCRVIFWSLAMAVTLKSLRGDANLRLLVMPLSQQAPHRKEHTTCKNTAPAAPELMVCMGTSTCIEEPNMPQRCCDRAGSAGRPSSARAFAPRGAACTVMRRPQNVDEQEGCARGRCAGVHRLRARQRFDQRHDDLVGRDPLVQPLVTCRHSTRHVSKGAATHAQAHNAK